MLNGVRMCRSQDDGRLRIDGSISGLLSDVQRWRVQHRLQRFLDSSFPVRPFASQTRHGVSMAMLQQHSYQLELFSNISIIFLLKCQLNWSCMHSSTNWNETQWNHIWFQIIFLQTASCHWWMTVATQSDGQQILVKIMLIDLIWFDLIWFDLIWFDDSVW